MKNEGRRLEELTMQRVKKLRWGSLHVSERILSQPTPRQLNEKKKSLEKTEA